MALKGILLPEEFVFLNVIKLSTLEKLQNKRRKTSKYNIRSNKDIIITTKPLDIKNFDYNNITFPINITIDLINKLLLIDNNDKLLFNMYI